jgi:hypothetical protein
VKYDALCFSAERNVVDAFIVFPQKENKRKYTTKPAEFWICRILFPIKFPSVANQNFWVPRKNLRNPVVFEVLDADVIGLSYEFPRGKWLNVARWNGMCVKSNRPFSHHFLTFKFPFPQILKLLLNHRLLTACLIVRATPLSPKLYTVCRY